MPVSVARWDMWPVPGTAFDLPHGVVYTGGFGAGAPREVCPSAFRPTAEYAQAILATGFPIARDSGGDALKAFIRRVQG